MQPVAPLTPWLLSSLVSPLLSSPLPSSISRHRSQRGHRWLWAWKTRKRTPWGEVRHLQTHPFPQTLTHSPTHTWVNTHTHSITFKHTYLAHHENTIRSCKHAGKLIQSPCKWHCRCVNTLAPNYSPHTLFFCRSVPLANVSDCWAIVPFWTRDVITALPADRVHVHLWLFSLLSCPGSHPPTTPPYVISPGPALGSAPPPSVKACSLIHAGPKFRLMRSQTWLWLQSMKEGVMSPKCSLANIKHNPVCLWSPSRVWNQAHQAAASLAEPAAARIHSLCMFVCEQMSLFVLLFAMIHCLCAGFEFGHVSRCI